MTKPAVHLELTGPARAARRLCQCRDSQLDLRFREAICDPCGAAAEVVHVKDELIRQLIIKKEFLHGRF